MVDQVNNYTKLRCKKAHRDTKLNCFYTNATSLVNKWNCINSLMEHHKLPHIDMVTETWFSDKSIINMSNYNTYNTNRNHVDSTRGGGVVIYIRDDIRSSEISDPTLNSFGAEMA